MIWSCPLQLMHIHLCKLAIRAVCTTGKVKFDRNGGPYSTRKSVYLGELDGLVTIKVIKFSVDDMYVKLWMNLTKSYLHSYKRKKMPYEVRYHVVSWVLNSAPRFIKVSFSKYDLTVANWTYWTYWIDTIKTVQYHYFWI